MPGETISYAVSRFYVGYDAHYAILLISTYVVVSEVSF